VAIFSDILDRIAELRESRSFYGRVLVGPGGTEGEAYQAGRWRLDEDIASGAEHSPCRICRAFANFIPSTAQTFQSQALNAPPSWLSEAP